MTTQHTYCRICEANCGLLVAAATPSSPLRLRPDPDHPLSQGFVCAKGLRFPAVADDPARLVAPLVRQADGARQQVSWDMALHRIASTLRSLRAAYGPDAIGIYFGTPMIHNALGLLSLFHFAHALGTTNLFTAGSQDNNNKFAGAQLVHGSPWIHPIPDLEQADVAILLGTNPLVSQSTFVHQQGGSTAYDRFRARGGRLIILDPRRTESAQRWGGHIPIQPGTDIYLLLAMLDALRDLYQPHPQIEGLAALLELAAHYPIPRAAALTGIPDATIRELVWTLRTTPRTTFLLSLGVNQGPFGTLSYVVVQALAWLSGNLDRPGGLLFQAAAPLVDWLLGTGGAPRLSRIGGYPSIISTKTCGVLAEEILTPGPGQIKALLVVGGNPLTSIPGEARLRTAFSSLELLVSADLFLNETAAMAHVVLPVTSWLERWDIASWHMLMQQAPLLQYTDQVCLPPGETRHEAQILADLSVRIGRPLFGSRLAARLWQQLPASRLVPRLLTGWKRWGRWRHRHHALPWLAPVAGRYVGRGPRTPGHRLRFWHSSLEGEPIRLATFATDLAVPRAEDTLILIGRRRRLSQNSWIHRAAWGSADPAVAWLAPPDMARLGLTATDSVRIETTAGALTLPVQASSDVLVGTIVVPHGVRGANINQVLSTEAPWIEPMSGMLHMAGRPVRVVRVDRGEAKPRRSGNCAADPGEGANDDGQEGDIAHQMDALRMHGQGKSRHNDRMHDIHPDAEVDQ
ncbi:MAG TPA: molybdopterin-dependent oxidoreductase [Herpetosiphonaceae bacterium]